MLNKIAERIANSNEGEQDLEVFDESELNVTKVGSKDSMDNVIILSSTYITYP